MADQTIGSACTTGAGSAMATYGGNNSWCNGSTWQFPAYQFGSSALSCTSSQAGTIQWTGSAFQGCNGASWTALNAGGSTALSSLLAATTTNSIDSSNWAQVWKWGTLSTQSALMLTSSSITSGKILDVEANNAAGTGYAGYFSNTATVGWALAATGTSYFNGNVGIGTASPVAALHVSGNIALSKGSTLLSSDSSGTNFINMLGMQNGNSIHVGDIARNIYLDTGSGFSALFNGSVGIGTTSPNAPLQVVNGTAANTGYAGYFQNTATAGINGGIYVSDGSAGAGTAGSFFAGGSGPNTAIYAWSNSQGAGYGVNSQMAQGNNTGYAGYFSNTSTTGWSIYASGGAPSYFAGNVGIGTTSPAGTLSINSTTTGAGYGVYATSATTTNGYGIYSLNSGIGNTGYAGYFANTSTGVVNYGLYASTSSGSGYAGYFQGAVNVAGALTVSSCSGCGAGTVLLGTATGSANPQRSGDATTGLLSLATTSVSIETGGNVALTVTATGSVGIGTASPVGTLDAYGAASYGIIHAINPTASSEASIGFYDAGDSNTTKWVLGKNVGGDTSGKFDIWNNGIRVSIDTYGNVGIGTTSPSDKLDVAGAIGLTTTTATVPVNGIYSPAANSLSLTASSIQALTISTTGYVGIGTTSPAAPLHVYSTGVASLEIDGSNANGIELAHNGADKSDIGYVNSGGNWSGIASVGDTVMRTVSGNQIFANEGNGNIMFSSGSSIGSDTERMRITSSGNVGIGTTSPAGKLSIAGTTTGTGYGVYATSATTTNGYGIYSLNGGIGNTGYAGYFTNTSTGVVNYGLYASTSSGSGYAGYFQGAVNVSGNLTVASCSGCAAAGTNSLSALTSATTTNSIDSTNFAQSWRWGTLSTQTALTLSTSSMTSGTLLALTDTSAGSGGTVLGITDSQTGTAYGVSSSQTNAGNSGYAGYFSNTGTAGWALAAIGTTYFNGNVGIGTATPSAQIDIEGNNTSPYIAIENNSSASANYPQLEIANYTGGNGGSPLINLINSRGSSSSSSPLQTGDSFGEIQGWGVDDTNSDIGRGASIKMLADGNFSVSSSPGAITFSTAPAGSLDGVLERMRINSSGNVGIGTTSPQALLQVGGGSEAAYDSNISAIFGTGGSGAGIQINSYNDSSKQFTIENSNGNITLNAIGTNAYLGINSVNQMTFGVTSAAPMVFGTNNSERMRILSGGNVGIGTNSPGSMLQVSGNAAIGYATSTAGPSNGLAVRGSVGIGTTSPSDLLDVNGAIGLTTTTATLPLNGLYSSTTNSLTLTTSGVNAMTITSTGSVGIGTASPTYPLYVNGTAYATGAAGALSDIRHKKNIAPLKSGLREVLQLKPVTFEWKQVTDNGMSGAQIGLIAQDVEKVLPTVVMTEENAEETKDLKYTELIPVLVKAIQELEAENDNLRAENEKEAADLAALRDRIAGQKRVMP